MGDTYTKLSSLSAEDENSQGTLKGDVNLPVVTDTVKKLDLCSIAGRESCDSTLLQIRSVNRDNVWIFFRNHQNICCDPSLEPSHRDDCNEGPQHRFLLRK